MGIHGEGVTGPVERKLGEYGEILGLVVGAFGEGSEHLHNLVQSLAECRVSSIGLARGQPCSENELAMAIGQVRRRLSVASIRATSNCLLTRLTLIGEGARQAAKRRGWREREELLMRHEREAQWVGRVRSHGVTHRGQFLLQ